MCSPPYFYLGGRKKGWEEEEDKKVEKRRKVGRTGKKGSRQEERSQSRALNLVPPTDGIQRYTNCEKAKSGMTFFCADQIWRYRETPFSGVVVKKEGLKISGKLGTDLRKTGRGKINLGSSSTP